MKMKHMQKEFKLKVSFRKAMNGPEQNSFWIDMGSCLQLIEAFGGGHQDVFSLLWDINYSRTKLDEHSVKKHIANFLDLRKEIVSDFSFYKK